MLVVLHRAGSIGSSAAWACQCDCGALKTLPSYQIRNTGACGCTHWKHRSSNTPEYRIWCAMMRRCYWKGHTAEAQRKWERYGGRGIRVCDRWRDFKSFLADMGERPSTKHSLDRINLDGHYEPTNCRWADAMTQSANRSNRTEIATGIYLTPRRSGQERYRMYVRGRHCGYFDTAEEAVAARARILGWPTPTSTSR